MRVSKEDSIQPRAQAGQRDDRSCLVDLANPRGLRVLGAAERRGTSAAGDSLSTESGEVQGMVEQIERGDTALHCAVPSRRQAQDKHPHSCLGRLFCRPGGATSVSL